MTPYPHIIARLSGDIWAITADAYEALWAGLERHVAQRGAQEPILAGIQVRSGQSDPSPIRQVGKGVSVVDINGVIGKKISALESMCGGVSVDSIVENVGRAAHEPGTDAVVMNWHSPGGSVTGVPEAYDELRKIGKKATLFSYTDSRMCSGAQWLANAATSVYAAGTADTGSVGVYQLSLDRTGQMAKDGVQVNAIHAGKYKLMGAPFKPLSNEEREMLQARVDDIHQQFKSAVSRGRPKIDKGALEGQVLSGRQAVEAGLIDGLYPSLASLVKAITR